MLRPAFNVCYVPLTDIFVGMFGLIRGARPQGGVDRDRGRLGRIRPVQSVSGTRQGSAQVTLAWPPARLTRHMPIIAGREEQKMPERGSAIPAWAWIVGAVLVIVSVFIGYRMVQTQQHLAAAQSELESAKQAAEKANAERKELKTKLDDATSEVKSAQSVLAETKSVLEAAQSELERATQAAEKANAQRNEIQIKLDEAELETKSVQSRLAETRSRLEAAQSELESAKQTADQAKAQVAELEQKAASLTSELQKADGQRIELQAKLDEAGSEIQRLKSELE